MKRKQKLALGAVLAALVVAVAGWYLHTHTIPVLQPAGTIGTKERNLIIFCACISAAIVIPVFGLLIYIATKYHEDAPHAKYSPELAGSRKAELIWWLVPAFIMVIISTVTWNSSYALDPFKPLSSTQKTLHIQVVALDWKWLFIYPDQNVASVNMAYIPVGTPVDFEITSDTVMTSFWVPQLGGQMYAMPGMETQLNLQANKAGSYNGVAANISGTGFADQKFKVAAVQPQLYSQSIASMRTGSPALDAAAYAKLAKPGLVHTPQYYHTVAPGLFDNVMMKFMMPMSGSEPGVMGVNY